MSQENTEQNRSEQPTSFKLAQSRRKGIVARGMDLGFLSGLAAFTLYAWVLGPGVEGRIAEAARRSLVAAPQVLASPNEILALVGAVLGTAARPLAFMAGAIFLVVLVFELAQTGVVFSAAPLSPDFSRLNPAAGLKRLFSVRLLIETGKSVLKLLVYSALAWTVIHEAFRNAAVEIGDARGLTEAMVRTGFRMLSLFIAAAVVFAVFDQSIARRDFLKKMRMSRREVKRENRDREGDPRMKQRRKQAHREFVKLSESLRNIRGSDVLITNPQHYAVALRYDARVMDAPLIVAQGAGQFAQRLKRLAFLYGVVIVPNPPLARALFRCELNKPTPEALFLPVAEIYRALPPRTTRAGADAVA